MELKLSAPDMTADCEKLLVACSGSLPLTCLDVSGHDDLGVHFAGIWSFLGDDVNRRLMACVNACAGIRTEALERRCHLLKAGDDQIATLSKQREQLLSALYLALPFVEDCEGDEGYKPGAVSKAVSTIKAAIAAVEPPKAAADGWIEWKGGERPVDGAARVEVKYADGMPGHEIAGSLRWSWIFDGANGGDIIAYRVVQEGGAA